MATILYKHFVHVEHRGVTSNRAYGFGARHNKGKRKHDEEEEKEEKDEASDHNDDMMIILSNKPIVSEMNDALYLSHAHVHHNAFTLCISSKGCFYDHDDDDG